MIITKSRRYHVNMGRFEWVEFGAEVTLDQSEDKTLDGLDVDELVSLADEVLDEALTSELQDAASNTDEAESFVIHLLDHPGPTKGKN